MSRDSYTDKTAAKWPQPPEGPGMALSPFVWSAGVLCLAGWAYVLWVVYA